MLIRCPSCCGGFDLSDEALGVRATVVCPLCSRVVVVRDAVVVPPGGREGTVPFDPGTEAAVDFLPDHPTDLAADAQALSLPARVRVSLAVLAGPRRGDILPVVEARVVIGRAGAGAGSDFEIADAEASRVHAALECHGARIVLRDLGSRNGTFVGEKRIQAQPLEDKDEFRIGTTRFMLILTTED